jgi:hypothetical protein
MQVAAGVAKGTWGIVSTRSRATRISAFTCRDNSRIINQCPPFQAFLDAFALPSSLRGPVDCSHGFHVRISAACLARRSGVQPFAIACLQ